MKAAQLVKFGKPLVIHEVELPALQPTEVKIRVRYAGINFYELLLSQGKYPFSSTLPVTPGGELSGEVIEVGSKVKVFRKDDRVFSFAQTGKGTSGSYAQVAQVDERYVYRVPERMSLKIAAVFPMVYFAAQAMLLFRVCAKDGDTVLVHSAVGGVGRALVQLLQAQYKRITLIGTCSTEEKVVILQKTGVNLAINTKRENLQDFILQRFSNGIDIVFDPVGAAFFDQHLAILRPMTGVLCSYGAYSGPITDASVVAKLRAKNITLAGFLMWPMIEDRNLCNRVLNKVVATLQKYKTAPYVDCVFKLEEVNRAIDRIQNRKNIGKILLKL